MNKKIIIVIIILIIIGLITGYFLLKNEKVESNNTIKNTKKILVAYYSTTGSTEKVAKEIANNLNADIFKIEPKEEYTSNDLDWNDDNSRVTKEHNDETLRNVELKTTTVDNWNDYDAVLIGYPIWWGIAAWPVDTFVKANDFSNKTVIPFCTSASSGLGESGTRLQKEAKGGIWKQGHRFSSSPTEDTIKEWTDGLQ